MSETSAENSSAPTTAMEAPSAPVEAAGAPEQTQAPEAEERVSARLLARIKATETRTRQQAAAAEAKAREAEAVMRSLAEERALKERAKSGDWEAREKLLEEYGISYDDLTRWKLTGGKVDPAEEVKRELNALKSQLSEREKAESERAESALWSERLSTFAQVAKDPTSSAPLVAGELDDDPEYVHATVRALVQQSPEMTYLQAVQAFESYLRQQTERRSSRIRPAVDKSATAADTNAQTATKNETRQSRPRDTEGRYAGANGPRRLTNAAAVERSTVADSTATPARTAAERARQERERIIRAVNALANR